MTPLRLLAIVEATSITGPAKNLLDFARRATEQNVFTTIVTFLRGEPENQFTETVRHAAARHEVLALEVVPERSPSTSGRCARSARLSPVCAPT